MNADVHPGWLRLSERIELDRHQKGARAHQKVQDIHPGMSPYAPPDDIHPLLHTINLRSIFGCSTEFSVHIYDALLSRSQSELNERNEDEPILGRKSGLQRPCPAFLNAGVQEPALLWGEGAARV